MGMAPSRSCLRSPASLLESRVDLWKDRRFSPVAPPDRWETMLTSLAPLLASIVAPVRSWPLFPSAGNCTLRSGVFKMTKQGQKMSFPSLPEGQAFPPSQRP